MFCMLSRLGLLNCIDVCFFQYRLFSLQSVKQLAVNSTFKMLNCVRRALNTTTHSPRFTFVTVQIYLDRMCNSGKNTCSYLWLKIRGIIDGTVLSSHYFLSTSVIVRCDVLCFGLFVYAL